MQGMSSKTSASLSRAVILAARARCAMSEGASLEKALEAACRGAGAAERAAAQALLYGATRRHMLVQFILGRLVDRAPEAMVRFIVLVALSELIETPEKSYVVCNEAVKAVKTVNPRAAGFANAIVRRFLRERETLLAAALRRDEVRLNAPSWWIAKLRADLGREEADALRSRSSARR